MVTVNQDRLKEIAHSTPTAVVTMTALALRERTRNSSDITRTRRELQSQGERIVDEDYMRLWKDLQDAGYGSIIFGRRGKNDRFEWHYSLKQVAQTAIGGNKGAALEPIQTKEAPKKRGRKPGSKNKRTKRSPGRPKGAKNKIKADSTTELAEVLGMLKTVLERLER